MHKGITPVIAVILLLLITISLVGFAFVFLGRTAETAAESGEQELEQQLQQFGTRFAIESINSNKIYVRNLGTTAIPNNSLGVYANNVRLGYGLPSGINPNDVKEITIVPKSCKDMAPGTAIRITTGATSDSFTIGEQKDGVYTIYPSGSPIEVYCDMTTDGGGWTMIWKNFGGPRYSSYSGQMSNQALWATTTSTVVAPFSFNSQIGSHKNVPAWNAFIGAKGVEWIKLVRSYDASGNLYTALDSLGRPSTFVVKLDLGDAVSMNDVMTTVSCVQLSNQVEMFIDGASFGKTDRTSGYNNAISIGFAANYASDHCSQPANNLMNGWEARHVISYDYTATGLNTVRCQFECWGATSPNIVTETVWGVR